MTSGYYCAIFSILWRRKKKTKAFFFIVKNSLPTCPYRMQNGGMATSSDFINKLIRRLYFQIFPFLVNDIYAQ